MDRAAKDISDVHTHINHIRVEMQSYATSVDTKITEAVKNKLDIKVFEEVQLDNTTKHEDYERRQRFSERYLWIAIGAVIMFQAVYQMGLLHYIVQGIVREELASYEVKPL